MSLSGNAKRSLAVAMRSDAVADEIEAGIHGVTTLLTDAQIRSLPSIAVEVFPAQGPDTWVLPIAWAYVLNTVAGAYVTAGPNTLELLTGPDYFNGADTATLGNHHPALVAQKVKSVGGALSVGAGDSVLNTFNSLALFKAGMTNQPILLCDFDGGSDYTGGDDLNWMLFMLKCIVVDVSSLT